ncbi:copper resistance protein CopC [Corynebacterium sp. zg-331]|uniref:copper resistance CopC family protein n=1 Tax=unclassified Corynebacterium TaxID=2624378 RepID=UPI00128D5B80|nr:MULTISPECIES: copper resistance CopC family protein [unclassified Corynebacterium]MBC3185433.1 copper resistance protein CopC [Corynebacterium sp. zg-331]MPV51928.1 copper resistance protein CopC [Corynebacterium sp. zg331]
MLVRIAFSRAIATTAAVLCVGAAGMMMPEAAHAHDSVTEASPEDGGVVTEFPREIILTFSGVPKDTFNTFAVSDSDSGEVLFSQEPRLDGRKVSVTVPEDIHPGLGRYTVGFQITSSDGHATRGKTTFSVARGNDPAVAESQASQDENASSVSGPLVWSAGGLGIVAIAAVAVMATARHRRLSEEME